MMIAPRIKTAGFPFLILLIGMVLVYSFLNWVIFIKSKTFIEYPTLLYIVVPAIFSIIFVVFWLRPLFCRLTFVFDRIRSLVWFQLIAVALLTTVTYFAQILLEERLTNVVELQDIAELYDHTASKFFSAQDYSVKKNLYGAYFSKIKIHYKGKVHYLMSQYFVFPIFSKRQQTPVVWVGIQFHESTGDSYHSKELEPDIKKFIRQSYKKIQNMSVENFHYLELMTDESDIAGFDHAVRNSQAKVSDNWLVMLGHYKPLQHRLAEDLTGFILSVIIALSIWFVLVGLLATDDPRDLLHDSKRSLT